jgi:hypothetical protein
MGGRSFWGGVIEFARWFSSGGFALWGVGLILLALHETGLSLFQPGAPSTAGDGRAVFALPLGAILIAVGALLFFQFGRAKRALMRSH